MTFSNEPQRRRFLRTALTAAGAVACPWAATAAYTAEAGRAVIGFQVPPPAMHLVSEVLIAIRGHYQPDLGTNPVVIAGGAGSMAVETVGKSQRDGATVLIGPSSLVTLLPIMLKWPDDPSQGLVPVAGIGEHPLVFMIGPAVAPEVRTMSEYVQWVRAHPSANAYGVPSLGSVPHFIGTEIGRKADLPLRAVGYKGPRALAADIDSGAIPAAITLLPDPEENVHPAVRFLSVSTPSRMAAYPGVPTLVETGLAEPTPVESLGLFLPTGTPEQKVAELAAAVIAARQTRAVLEAMGGGGLSPMPHSVESYASALMRERATWQALVAGRNFTGQN